MFFLFSGYFGKFKILKHSLHHDPDDQARNKSYGAGGSRSPRGGPRHRSMRRGDDATRGSRVAPMRCRDLQSK